MYLQRINHCIKHSIRVIREKPRGINNEKSTNDFTRWTLSDYYDWVNIEMTHGVLVETFWRLFRLLPKFSFVRPKMSLSSFRRQIAMIFFASDIFASCFVNSDLSVWWVTISVLFVSSATFKLSVNVAFPLRNCSILAVSSLFVQFAFCNSWRNSCKVILRCSFSAFSCWSPLDFKRIDSTSERSFSFSPTSLEMCSFATANASELWRFCASASSKIQIYRWRKLNSSTKYTEYVCRIFTYRECLS